MVDVRMHNINIINTDSGTMPVCISVDGPSVTFSINEGDLSRKIGALPFGTLCQALNGANITMSGFTISGYVTVFDAPSDGGTPTLNISNVQSDDATTLVNGANVNTDGHIFSDISSRSGILVDPSTSFHISNRNNNVITVGSKGADFTSVADAIAFVNSTPPTETHPVTIAISGGHYFEENPIVVPNYCTFRGDGKSITTIFANNTDQAIFSINGSYGVSFHDLAISGASGSGGSGIQYSGALPPGIVNSVFCFAISIQNCETAWDVTSDNGFALLVIRDSNMLNITSTSKYGVRCRPTSAIFPIILLASTFSAAIPAAVIPTVADPFTFFAIEGTTGLALSQFSLTNVQLSHQGVTPPTGLYGLSLNNASGVTHGWACTNLSVIIDIVPSVLPVTLQANGMINFSSTLMIRNANNSSAGTFNGTFDVTNIDESDAPTNGITYMFQNTTGGISLTGSLNVGETLDELVDYIPGLAANINIGIIEGGAITFPGGLGVEVSAGSGYITAGNPGDPLLYLEWSTVLTETMPADSDRFLSVIKNGTVTLQLTAGAPSQYNSILLGRIKSDTTSILYLQDISFQGLHSVGLIDNTLRNGLGPVVSSGLIGSAGTGAFQISVTSGRYFYSTHEYTPSGGTDLTFTEYYHVSGVFEPQTPVSQLTSVLVKRYDDGTDLVTLGSGWLKHVLYMVNDGSLSYYAFLYAQEVFTTQNAAENGALPLPPSYFDDNFVTIASFVITTTSVDWESVQDVRPTLQFTASGVTATTNHGSLSGLLADDHPQYLLVDGTRAMSGALDMGSQNITSVGTINSVTITNLSGRLEPGGADELSTAAPVTIGTANNIGSATSFSRSDHVHAHGVQTDATLHAVATGSTNGFLSSADKSKLDASTSASTVSTLVERDGSGSVSVDGLVVDGGGSLSLANTANTFVTTVQALPGLLTDTNFTLPPNNGTSGFVLETNGAGCDELGGCGGCGVSG